jgi:hypothetical protein
MMVKIVLALIMFLVELPLNKTSLVKLQSGTLTIFSWEEIQQFSHTDKQVQEKLTRCLEV